jgi:kinesin family protein 11
MIPQTLFRLFHELEKTATDYSVKISFVGLYIDNEELHDFLANDFMAPSGLAQPMDRGSKDASGAAQNGLKIFDKSNKKGVFIQGLIPHALTLCSPSLFTSRRHLPLGMTC